MTEYVAKDLVNKAEELGFVEDRIRGDHHIFKNIKDGRILTIPYTSKKSTVHIGTARAILRVLKIYDK